MLDIRLDTESPQTWCVCVGGALFRGDRHVTVVPLGVSLRLSTPPSVPGFSCFRSDEATCVCESGLITASCFIITTGFCFLQGTTGKKGAKGVKGQKVVSAVVPHSLRFTSPSPPSGVH